ncbi:MAG: tagaturonate epimerase family protein [Planctomycetota bacterium]
MRIIEKFTFGIGDRFAHQAAAQLRAFEQLSAQGVDVTPVWNKSRREHQFVGSDPASVHAAAAAAVADRGWAGSWHVDADHIGRDTVDPFVDCSDFFTIDVADFIGKPASADDLDAFVKRHGELVGSLDLPGLSEPLQISVDDVRRVAGHYLLAAQEAGQVYRHIVSQKGSDDIIAEVSMDETESPQTPRELLIILAAIADQELPMQTIAPKFTGRFNKGVDYVGDLEQFRDEFNNDLAVIAHAIATYGLPKTLKLSVHSGSDKFSLYPIIRESLQATGAGLHLKTAGTTWLEEIIGLAEAGGDGLALSKEIYGKAFADVDAFCAPYASVIDIDSAQLPDPSEVNHWDGPRLASAIRHIPGHEHFNPHMRQLLHVAFKVAAKEGSRYTGMLKANAEIVGKQVTDNIYQRHLVPLFLG